MSALPRRIQRLLLQPGRRDKIRHKVRRFVARRRPAVRANRALMARELATHSAQLESHPTTLIIDPVTACNLRCPFCPTGGGYAKMKRELLTPELFERVTQHLRTELLEEVFLYNWGEPFLNPHSLDYIRHFARRGIYTEISTNFSMQDFDDDFFERLVDSGLSELKVSVDGASQETYEKYRVRGDFERVVRNMQRLAEIKRARRRSYPHVTYRMLLNKHNQHDVAAAAEIAEACGADFNPDPGFWCPDDERDEWMADTVAAQADANGSGNGTASNSPEPGTPTADVPLTAANDSVPGKPAPIERAPIETYCRQLWDTVIVNANGDVYPCCLIFKPEHEVGNLAEQDISEVRNAPKMLYLRRYVTDPETAAPDFDNHCEGCTDRHCVVQQPAFRQQPRQ
ncbi:MAG: radical SAM/SPASM domain-containing protein [Acidobacteriota bacterium]